MALEIQIPASKTQILALKIHILASKTQILISQTKIQASQTQISFFHGTNPGLHHPDPSLWDSYPGQTSEWTDEQIPPVLFRTLSPYRPLLCSPFNFTKKITLTGNGYRCLWASIPVASPRPLTFMENEKKKNSHPRIAHGQRYPIPCLK